jgi:endonuclease YncB( thermonuclease family)
MFSCFKRILCCKGKRQKNTLNKITNKSNDLSYLNNIEYNDTIPFIPHIVYVKVIKVYDGDTITVASKLPLEGSPIYRFSVRLAGIDSPEIKGSSSTEKKLAIKSRDALHKLIFGKIIELRNHSKEKYGRLLADVYFDNIHVNKWMLDKKLAVEYNGGKKIRPENWD